MKGQGRAKARGRRAFVAAIVACAGALLFSPAAALAYDGVLSGTVTDASGPVVGARVIALGAANNQALATTDAAGHYEVEAWPDTYRVGAYPPSGSGDGFASVPGVVLTSGGSAVANVTLGAAKGSEPLSGHVFYAGNPTPLGIEVSLYEERYESGPIYAAHAFTDAQGNWQLPSVPSGLYDLTYTAYTGGANPTSPESHLLHSEDVYVEYGGGQSFSQELSGVEPSPPLVVNVTSAEGWPLRDGSLSIRSTAGGSSYQTSLSSGSYRFVALAPGSYEVTVAPSDEEDDAAATTTVTVAAGAEGAASLRLPGNPVPAGVASRGEATYLADLNAQRHAWGLPASLTSVPLWSQACAAHDAYLSTNHLMEHPEQAGLPGHSIGGQWAGEHSILAGDNVWSAGENPWMDAPIHLDQLLTPDLGKVGIDGDDYSCVTTWPGIEAAPHPGTIYTFPPDGATGIPPEELASELPTTPNATLGIPALAGRQLFVYEEGTEKFTQGFEGIRIESASLSSAAGSVPVKVSDAAGALGAYLTGPIIVPTVPLQPLTTYTATVTIAAAESDRGLQTLPPVTHTWSFTTGHDNPGGAWSEGVAGTPVKAGKKRAHPKRRLFVSYGKGHVIVRGLRFRKGHVVIRRRARSRRERRLNGRLLARAPVNRKGTFVARFRWPRAKPVAFRAVQGGHSTRGSYHPRHRHRRPRTGRPPTLSR